MKLITVDDFLAWHNNAGGFLSYPVIGIFELSGYRAAR